MSRTEMRWKDGQFKGGMFGIGAQLDLVVDFGEDLAPDRLVLSLDVIVTTVYRFHWKATNDPNDLAIDIPSPELWTMSVKGVGHRTLYGGATHLILEISEGKRYWILQFDDDPTDVITIEGGQSAAPTQ